MRVSREQAARNRERVLKVASRLFRERGFEGVSVAELMRAAGLTHGGFYGQFSSKEDLMAQACEQSLVGSLERWSRPTADAPESPLQAIAAHYLSVDHRDHPGTGCLLAALGTETSRQAAPFRRAVTACVRSLVAALARFVSGRSEAARRERALATFASLVGAMVLARAVDDTHLSDEILAAVSATVAGLGRSRGSTGPDRPEDQ
jgi:TetR/AcrR family transcriptional regulator, transcriptional repressor for nem operon